MSEIEAPFRILVICTANICRSPMFESMLNRIAADRGLAAHVSSAGFLFHDEPASPAVAEVMGERGHDLAGHRSRKVIPELVAEADLVLTMQRSHAREIVLGSPDAVSRIHTAAGFASAVGELIPATRPGDDPAAIVERVDSGRLPGDLLGVGSDEVSDPYGRSRRFHRDTADQLEGISTAVMNGLFPA